MAGTFIASNLLAVFAIIVFVAATLSDYYKQTISQYLTVAAWILFGVFWLNLVEYFAFIQLSVIEGLLCIVAVPACFYVAYLTYTGERDFPLVTRAVTVMFLIYFPIISIPNASQFLIETVARQVNFIVTTLGYNPDVVIGTDGYRSTFLFTTDGHGYRTRVVLACSGIGSISIITGLISSVRASPAKKLHAIAFAVPIIWILNVVRVTFIALAHGNQWFRIGVDTFMTLGVTDPNMVSYLIADRIIAQSMSVIALVVITLLLVRLLPELDTVLNEVIEPLFGETYDFKSVFDT